MSNDQLDHAKGRYVASKLAIISSVAGLATTAHVGPLLTAGLAIGTYLAVGVARSISAKVLSTAIALALLAIMFVLALEFSAKTSVLSLLMRYDPTPEAYPPYSAHLMMSS